MPKVTRAPIDLRASLANLARGGLPSRAVQRLADEASGARPFFTSDLSVNEFMVSREVNCNPISQVMGTTIYHIGRVADYKGKTGELTTLSDAHRDARRMAISRIYQEATAVGADAVIGVRLGERPITAGTHGKGGDDGGQVIEFTVIGTAVRAPWITHPQGQPVITDLSGQDLWALARDGFEPCGLLFDFCHYHVWHVMDPNGWTPGGEITAAAQGVEAARRLVADRVSAQAQRAGAEFVVGSDIKVSAREVSCGWEGCNLNDLDIDITWFATGVRRIPGMAVSHKANVPPLVLGMMPLGRRKKGDVLEGEADESERLAEIAKRAEEKAQEGGGKE